MVRTAVAAASLLASGLAAATLTVTPLTWNVIGLDSNSPASGPRHFPVGARICSSTETTNVTASFVWDSANANINTRPGSLTSITVPTLAAGACTDAYFEIEVTPTSVAFDTTRRYHITAAADGTGTASTPVPREIYVEHLVSQARNEVSDVQLNGVSVLPGGTMTLMVGGTYDIKLVGATATQGYNQLESFINFPNTIFRVLSVSTTYTADSSNFVSSPNDRLYADACGWENHPSSPNYRSCVGVAGVGSDGKAGGGVTTTYTVQILSGAGTTQPLNTLIYDFSGSSYHYNGDYAVGARFAQIVDPVPPTFTKAFAPSTVLAGGSTVLTLSIGNANPTGLTNVAFTDVLPASPAQLLIAAAPAPTLSGCGAATLIATAGTSTISLTNASVAANGACTVSVPIAVPAAPLTGSYNNTTGPLSVNGTATAITASATLNVANRPPPSPGACVSTVDIARWTMDIGQGLGVPPAPSYVNPLATTATASFSGANSILSGTGSPANSWGGTGWNDAGIPTSGVGPYYQLSADTSKFYGVRVIFDANPLVNGDWANPGNNFVYVWSSADGGAYSSPLAGFPLSINKNAWTAGLSGTAAATGASTSFRISINGANKASATLALDNIRIVGCVLPVVPTLTKTFSPNPITVGGTSTLTFTLTNTNTVPLTGAAFSDQLPASVTVASPLSATTTCGGTWAPTVGASTLSFSGGTIPASSSCTASVNVTASSAGAKLNISDFITAAESGANTTASGVATATLDVNPVILPPVAAKSFTPAAVVAGQKSILTATLQNPNSTTTLTNVQLVDIYPGDLLNTNPLVPAVINGCGGTLTASAGGNGFSLMNVTLAPNASCSIEIPVAAATVGAKVNTTAPPQSTEGGAGTAVSATLTVGAAAPALSLSKRVGETAAGPWFDFAVISPTGPVYYQFIVENIGNVPFASFSVSDPLLAGGGADPAGCVWQTINAPTTLPGLPVASATLDPTAVCVRGPVSAGSGAVLNTATATGVYNAANYTNDDDATYVGADPNLSLIKEISTSAAGPWVDSIASIAPGASVYYRFTIINNGAQPVTGLSITDAMVSTASCAYVDPLPVGDASICVAGPVTTAGAPGATVTNTATVNGTSGGNPVTDTDTASYTLTPPSADVSVVKTLVTAGPYLVGQSISYSLVVANAGPDAATSVQVTDTPTNLTITGVSGGGCAALPCTIASLASGASTTITVTATINAVGAFDNSASVAATETDPVPGNNTDNTGNNGTASASADVSVVKTLVTAGPYLVGQSISYSLVVANAGPSTATSVQVTDTPTNLSITGVSGGGCAALPCTIASLASGASVTLTVTATINAVGAFDNSATVSAIETDTVPGNNTDSTGNGGTAGTSADVSVVKTLTTAGPFLVGQSITYSLVVANAGPQTATSVQVTDTPTNLSITGVSGGGCAALPCTIASLASGANVTITVTATINAVGAFDNAATVAATETDPNPGNNTDNTGNGGTANASADVSVVKTLVTAGPYLVGQSISYSLVVANAGPSTATSVQVTDTPTNLTVTGVSGGGCAALPCTIASLASGASVTITVTATINAVGAFDNSASVAATETDPVPGNNTDNTGNSGTASSPSADLSITKSDGLATVTAGGSLTYTIVASNAGPNGVSGATVADTFPVSLTGVTWTCVGAGGGTCPASGSGNINAAVNLPVGGSVTFTANATVALSATGSIVNTATVSSSTSDPVPGNNSATDTTTVSAAPPTADLQVTKSNGVNEVSTGASIAYLITVTNLGPDTATGAVLHDPSVIGVAKNWVICSSTPGVCVTPPSVAELESGTFALPALASGQSYRLLIMAAVTALTGESITNSVTVTAPAGITDPVPGNNFATDVDPVVAVPAGPVTDLILTKTRLGPLVLGSLASYEIVITNAGPSAVTGARVFDYATAGLSSVSWTCAVTAAGAGPVTTACSATSGTGQPDTTVTLNPGATVRFLSTGTVTGAPGSTTVNTASVAVPLGIVDIDSTNNIAATAATIDANADISVSKGDAGTTVLPGSQTSYTISVANLGPHTALNVSWTDTLPAGTTFVSLSSVGGWTCITPAVGANGTVSCTSPDMLSGTSTGFVLTVAINPGLAVGTVISNTTTATSDTPDPVLGNNSSTDTNTVGAAPPTSADMSISKGDAGTTVLAGSQTTYAVMVANLGPDAAVNVTWTDPLPAGTTFVSLSSVGGWTCVTPAVGANGTVTCSNSSMPPSSSTGFLLTVAMDPGLAVGTVINNTATVTSTTPDPVPGNNTATDSNTVVAVPAPVADLGVTKTNGTAQVTAGQPSTYTMVITNNGPEAAPNVTLTDTLPVQMTFTSLTAPGGWSCTTPAVGATGTVSCSTPSMASEVTATFVLSVTVVPSTPGGSTISNTVTVSSGASDPVLGNNQATDTDTLVAAAVNADLAIAKSNSGSQLMAGGSTTYLLTVSNLGPDEVTGAVVTDIAPTGLTFTSWTCTVTNPGTGGTVTTACVTGSGLGNVNATVNLKAGAVVAFSVAATVASNASGSISNTATVNTPAGVTDPALGNNSATDTDTIAMGPQPVVEVPTLSEWALAVMSLLLAVVAMRSMRVGRR